MTRETPHNPDAAEHPPPRRRRRWPYVLLLVFIAVVLGSAYVVERYVLDIDQYRGDLIDEIEGATGLSASIGRLELAWTPVPHVIGYDVSVGDGDFQATSRQVRMYAELRPLLDRQLNITELILDGLRLTVPPDPNDLEARVDTLFDHLNAPSEGEPLLTADVYEVRAEDAEVWLDGDTEAYLRVAGTGTDILSDAVDIALDARLLRYGTDAAVDTVFTIALEEGAIASIAGDAEVSAVDLAQLPYDWAPEATLRGTFGIRGTGPDYLSFAAAGAIDSRDTAALTSAYTADIWWDHGDLTVNDLNWNAEGLEFHADATYYADNRLAVRADTLALFGDALEYALEQTQSEEFRLVNSADARLEGERLLLSRSPEGAYSWVEGLVRVRGIDVSEADSDAPITKNAKGTFEAEAGRIDIRELTGAGFSFAGWVKPDFEANRHSFDVRGNVDLATAPLGKLVIEDVHDIRGALTLERVAGTFDDWPELPADLVVEGTVKEGAFRYASDAYEDTFTGVEAAFATADDGIDSTVEAASSKLGPLRLDGRYTTAARSWAGTATADVPRIVDTFVESEEQKARIQSAVNRFGESTFTATATLATDERPETRIEIERRGEPPLRATAAIAEVADGMALRDVQATTRLPAADFEREFPEAVTAEGLVDLAFFRDAAAGTFSLDASLDACRIAAGTWLEKRPGVAAALNVVGTAAEEWAVGDVTVTTLGESVTFRLVEDRLVARNLAMNVEPLAPIVKDATSATGRVTGYVASNPIELQLTLAGVGLHMSDKLAIDSVDGDVAYRDGYPAVSNLLVKSANSDCVINGGRRDGKWTGSLRGEKFDVNALLVLVEEFEALIGSEEELDEPWTVTAGESREPFLGNFDLAVDQLYYRRGRLDFVRAKTVIDDGGWHINDLTCRPYTGKLTGDIDIVTLGTDETDLNVNLTFENIDARIIDDMVLAESRGMKGIMSGRLGFNAPMRTPREAVRDASGEFRWSAIDGSFGRLGWATRLLSVLRTTEIFAMRLPPLRDEGLIYDTCSGKLVMEEGVIRFQEATLKSPAYSMEASGVIDYALDATDVRVRVEPLKGVGNLVSRVPLLRDVVDVTTSLVQVPVRIGGSPNDLTFGVEEPVEVQP